MTSEALVGAAEEAASLRVAAMEAARRQQIPLAIDLLARAAAHKCAPSQWLADLAMLQYAAGRLPEAHASFEAAAAAHPLRHDALLVWSEICLRARNFHRALAICDLFPSSLANTPKVLCRRACALRGLGQLDHAVETLERCLALDPACAPARQTLAEIMTDCGFYFRALQEWNTVAAAEPGRQFRHNLLRARFHAGDARGAADLATHIQPHLNAGDSSQLLRILLHDDRHTAASLRAAHQQWASRFAPTRNPVSLSVNRDPERRLRIGYLGGEFHRGAGSFFLLPLVERGDRDAFEVTCYHASTRFDSVTERFQQLAGRWRDVSGRAPADIAALTASDEIDILVDLGGHFFPQCLNVFPYATAPLRFTIPNYPATTGLPAIDFIVTGQWTCPPGAETQYTERALRLRHCYLSYAPPREPALTPPPAGNNGYITFGVFQRAPKLTPSFLDTAARVLSDVPHSKLLIQNASTEMELHGLAAAHYRGAFAERGIAPKRIITQGAVRGNRGMETCAQADIALDTFPYNGQTTTCECLWMGVPVIALAGETHVARVAGGILNEIGAPELVAANADQYVHMASHLAQDRARLQMYRRSLRSRMRSSSLLDGRAVRQLENAYREQWRTWCANPT